MSTSKEFVNIVPTRLLGYSDFGGRFLNYLKEVIKETHATVWNEGSVYDAKLGIAADGSGKIQITGTSLAANGLGQILNINAATVKDGIDFENTNTIDYYVALKYAEIPNGIIVNSRTGLPNYVGFVEEIGESADPDSVVDNGDGTITFVVDSITEASVSNAGRQVVVYKKTPAREATTETIAIETCTVTWDASNNKITTVDSFGQTTISTTASDYTVVLLGPTIKRNTDLRGVSGYTFLGIVTGNGGTPVAFDTNDQLLASISLAQLAHITRLASNNRLKVDVTPLSTENGINQISSRNTNGDVVFGINEKGIIDMDSPPYIGTQSRPTHPGNSVSNTIMQTSLSDVQCIVNCTINGKRKIVAFDKTTLYAEIWDIATMSLDSSTDVSALFETSYEPLSACSDDKYIYVWTSDGNDIRIQALDASNWTKKSGWPSTGIYFEASSTAPNTDYQGNMIVNVDANRIAVGTWTNSHCIATLSKDDGTELDYGAGDGTTTNQARAICCDGLFIYALFSLGDGGTAQIVSADLNDLTTGSGVSGWPINRTGESSTTYKAWIAEVDNYVVVSRTDASRFWAYSKNGTTDYEFNDSFTSSYPTDISYACSDGTHIWLKSEAKLKSMGDTGKTGLFRFLHERLISQDSSTSMRIIYDWNEFFEPIVPDNDVNYDGEFYGSGMLFDGKDLFCKANPAASNWLIYRIPNILYKKTSPVILLPKEKNIPVSSGVLDIDCNYSHINTAISANITDVNYLNTNECKRVTVRLIATGSYTVDGFETGATRKWLATPRPSFAVSSGETYLLELYITPSNVVLSQWLGPFTDL